METRYFNTSYVVIKLCGTMLFDYNNKFQYILCCY